MIAFATFVAVVALLPVCAIGLAESLISTPFTRTTRMSSPGFAVPALTVNEPVAAGAALGSGSCLYLCPRTTVKPVCYSDAIIVVEYTSVRKLSSCINSTIKEIYRKHLSQGIARWMLQSNVIDIRRCACCKIH